MTHLKIMIGQLNPVLGALESNARKAVAFYRDAATQGADYALLSELYLTGYSLGDLFLRPKFLADVENMLNEIAAQTSDTILGIGAPVLRNGKRHIAYVYMQNGQIIHEVLKVNLPNYDVFDEKRRFESGDISEAFGDPKISTAICEDLWHESYGEAILPGHPDILIVPNASPYYRGKIYARHDMAKNRAKQLNAPVVYIHYVGAEDEMVFDGGSFVAMPNGEISAQMPMFHETRAMIEFDKTEAGWELVNPPKAHLPNEWEADYHAMVLGLRDYAAETGFQTAILGLSGGIDSALVAAIAADALGPENVRVVMMPSEYTSQESLDDAGDCAARLGIHLDQISIASAVDATSAELEPIFGADPQGLTAENIQPRLRALYLMALSNRFGSLLLTTGNKSEVAVGYSTLYGDMAGGFNPIKDLYKMRVFETCRWRNSTHFEWMLGRSGSVIPQNIIDKAPSAELRPDQKDSDSLPEYPQLDAILEAMVDRDQSIDQIVAMGHDREAVLKVQRLVYIAEFKRFQAAPGVKLTQRHFGTDRRYSIVNQWRDR